MLAGYSASMLALLDNGNPVHVYALGWDRLVHRTDRRGCRLVVGWLFTPVGAEIPGDGRVPTLRAACCATSPTLPTASGHSALSPRDLAERLAVMAAIEEGLDPHAAGSQRSRRAVRCAA
jgi:hypothetical protein